MKMIYHQRDSKQQQKKTRRFFTSLIIIAVIAIGVSIVSPHFFSPIAHAANKPIFSTSSFFEDYLRSFFELLHTKQQLIEENKVLKERVQYVQSIETERNFYKTQAEQFLQLLGQHGTSTTIAIGLIISKPGFSPYDTFIINIGSSDGIKAGDTVLADGSIVIGEVAEVYSHSSTVILYSSPGQKVNVLIGSQGIEKTAEGKGGGTFEVKLPRNTLVTLGDTVALARSPQKIFGTIGSIMSTTADSFEQILFKNPIDINKITTVLIEK